MSLSEFILAALILSAFAGIGISQLLESRAYRSGSLRQRHKIRKARERRADIIGGVSYTLAGIVCLAIPFILMSAR